ncbi:Phospholipase B domain-containing protein [Klebsormidium nitens]|uniref:Phospholipase B-like n=1 Tax=Klebsormidium nitens TaxID=105231 RepID=A0A1Y1HK37_KLENI|nr:Phospholipase B domain-containing protein [Klebsormidium nitens]|eukprot:GAQ78920.1 Phospholipase B domain-containing protein [Klebsormidium nitens]
MAAMAHVASFLLLWSLLVCIAAEPLRLSVSISRTESGEIKVSEVPNGGEDHACASGVYQREYTNLGWNFLQITTGASCPDPDQAYAAGFVEGALTWEMTWDHWQNTKDALSASDELPAFLAANDKYVSGEIAAEHLNSSEAFWWQVSLVLEQLKGLAAGYNSYASTSKKLTLDDFLRMNSDGDFYDLIPALKLKKKDSVGGHLARKFGALRQTVERTLGINTGRTEPNVNFDDEDLTLRGQQKCSALVKVMPDFSEIFVAQAAFSGLEELLRIYKLYDFAFHTTAKSADVIPGRRSAFSSYPAHVISGDDFYLISSGIVAVETTIGTFNDDLYRNGITPEGSVFEWLRNMVANRLATSAEQWTSIFSQHNSGTYNNQWLIVDFNLFEPGEPLKDGTLYVLEQYPGYIAAYDATEELRTANYFASYNTPHNKTAYELAGYPAMVTKFGDFYTVENSPRAHLFAREHVKVTDIDSFKHTVRYNDFKNDPLGRCANCTPPYNGEFGISSRGDLNVANGSYPFKAVSHRDHASLDAKVTSGALFKSFSSIVVAGPTCDQQPPFDWSTSDFNYLPHQGHVTEYAFPWVKVDWEGLRGATLTINSTACSAY